MKKLLANVFFYLTGLVFLTLARIKFAIRGYQQSSFTTLKLQTIVDYDLCVVDDWLKQLSIYSGRDVFDFLKNKSVLELGPGADLGIGLYLLSKSVGDYTAVDTYNLIKYTPREFYDLLFSKFQKNSVNIATFSEELDKALKGSSEKINYLVRPDFDLVKAIAPKKMDLIFSQAAFEHFDNIRETIKQMSTIARPGAYFVAVIDLQTHSRWIRQKDPNNIYRYPDWLYRLFTFRGAPNRMRPYQYIEALKENGWNNIKIYNDQDLSEEKFNLTTPYLNSQFRDSKNEMRYLSIWLCATKS